MERTAPHVAELTGTFALVFVSVSALRRTCPVIGPIDVTIACRRASSRPPSWPALPASGAPQPGASRSPSAASTATIRLAGRSVARRLVFHDDVLSLAGLGRRVNEEIQAAGPRQPRPASATGVGWCCRSSSPRPVRHRDRLHARGGPWPWRPWWALVLLSPDGSGTQPCAASGRSSGRSAPPARPTAASAGLPSVCGRAVLAGWLHAGRDADGRNGRAWAEPDRRPDRGSDRTTTTGMAHATLIWMICCR
jgi:hypothetical protein